MPPFDFDMFRRRNIFGNDMPEQGGIMGNMPPPARQQGPFRQPNFFEIPQISAPMPSGIQTPQAAPMPGPEADLDINAIFQQMYTPETRANDYLMNHISSMPERNQPGNWRKAASVLAGMGPDGAQAQERVLYSPYHRAMEDWQAKYKPLSDAATMERQNNINERTLAHNTATSTINARRAGIQADAENRRRTSEENKTRIAQSKLELERFKAEHPDWELQNNTDGYIYLVNPKDPGAKPVNTGLQHGDLTDLEKEQWALRRKQTPSGDDNTNWKIFYDYSSGKPVAYERNSATGQTRAVFNPEGMPAQGRPNAPTQQNAALTARANKLISQNPAFNDYIQVDDTGVRIVGDPPQEMREYIESQLYNDQIPGNINLNPKNTKPPARGTGAGPRGSNPNAAPPGTPPNAKPRQLRSGKTIWVVE